MGTRVSRHPVPYCWKYKNSHPALKSDSNHFWEYCRIQILPPCIRQSYFLLWKYSSMLLVWQKQVLKVSTQPVTQLWALWLSFLRFSFNILLCLYYVMQIMFCTFVLWLQFRKEYMAKTHWKVQPNWTLRIWVNY